MMADAPKYDYSDKKDDKPKSAKSFFVFAEENEGKILEHIEHLEQCQTETVL